MLAFLAMMLAGVALGQHVALALRGITVTLDCGGRAESMTVTLRGP